ncbi:DNA-binding response regulator [Robertkochia aurantiaca]|uniref:DNA-binding response regulator n=1 Tax=Robertkochia aurantiaca TaxID=2873700 RepID=UPI001CCC5D41|nr:response regulator [Robertkochia sp. 3YJGBD-33]
MIKKVLIAEDIDSIGLGLVRLIEEEFNFEVVQARYCDEAWLKLKRAHIDKQPFDLLITDLSFKEDHRNETIEDGAELVRKIREEDLPTKVVMYSIEDRPVRIRSFYNDLQINGYVMKGRNSSQLMKEAVQSVLNGDTYYPDGISEKIHGDDMMEIEDYDILLLEQLALGYSQDEISEKFKGEGIKPASLSSIEKRLNKLKIYLKAKNTIHLVAIAKDMGLI